MSQGEGLLMVEKHYDYCIGTANFSLKKSIITILSEAGFSCAGESDNIPLFLRKIRTVQPWFAVVDTALPPGNIEQLASIIESDGLAAGIYINHKGKEILNYVQINWPLEASALPAVARAVCSEFYRKRKLQKEIDELNSKLHTRKIVERAKGLLVKSFSVNEEEAYRLIQKASMDKRLEMAETAAEVIKDPMSFYSFLRPR